MLRMNRAAVISLLAISMIAGLSLAQEPPAFIVVPSKATMLVGDTHTFRAVGKDGRMRHNVRWSILPEHAATLTTDGDEATVNALEPTSTAVLTAYSGGDSSDATIEIRAGASLSTGTPIWSVTNLPGCKTTKITPAVPSANGPDVYVEESCPKGTFVRAVTSDGRELWRRMIGGPAGILQPRLKSTEQVQPGEHLNLSAQSLCDVVSYGMTKDAVSKLAQDRDLPLAQKAQEGDSWVLEEDGFRCNILFDKAGAVEKKKKTVVTD